MTRMGELNAFRLGRDPHESLDIASIDPVSGLPTRPSVIADLEKTLSKSKHKASVAVAIVEFSDIGGFRSHNEKPLLKQLSSLLRAWVPPEYAVGHLRGREFAIIFRGVPLCDIQRLANDIVEKIRREPTLQGQQRRIVTIIGLGCSSRGEGDASHLLTLANIALHYARSTGRGWHALVDSAFVPRSYAA